MKGKEIPVSAKKKREDDRQEIDIAASRGWHLYAVMICSGRSDNSIVQVLGKFTKTI